MIRKRKVVSGNLYSKYFYLTGEDNGHSFALKKNKSWKNENSENRKPLRTCVKKRSRAMGNNSRENIVKGKCFQRIKLTLKHADMLMGLTQKGEREKLTL